MIAPADLRACRAAIAEGSYSFHAASRLLPAHVRDPALVLYAFCRMADDAVDLVAAKPAAVLRLRDRLDLAYAGTPVDSPADRAFAQLIRDHDLPRVLPDALLEGLAWDGMGHRYATLSELRAYAARVASAVGAMMCVLMGVRDADALARACDLGVAMQLTNIARDVGEDAAAGRLYLPTGMLHDAGINADAFLADPRLAPGIVQVVRHILVEADRLYHRSEAGIRRLPLSVRPGIYAARLIYDGIGRDVAHHGYDSLGRRARTSRRQKLGLLAVAGLRAGVQTIMPQSAVLHAPPLPETAFLVDAARRNRPVRSAWGDGSAGALLGVLAQLETRDRLSRGVE